MARLFKNAAKFLADLPSTNYKAYIGGNAAMLSVGMFWICTLLEVEINEVAFGMMLSFIATLLGLSWAQYRTKRQTHIPETNGDEKATRAQADAEVQTRRASSEHEGTEFAG